jgi:hypothetical protein
MNWCTTPFSSKLPGNGDFDALAAEFLFQTDGAGHLHRIANRPIARNHCCCVEFSARERHLCFRSNRAITVGRQGIGFRREALIANIRSVAPGRLRLGRSYRGAEQRQG